MADAPLQHHVLIIDDEDLLRWSLRQALEGVGYRVTDLASGESAVATADRADIILLDWRLPSTDGSSCSPSGSGNPVRRVP